MPPIPQFTVDSTSGQQSTMSPSPGSSTVYAFLTTFVLLLFIGAVMAVRDVILGRRHRLTDEEAIRNGTWEPLPLVTPASQSVDLSKKPKMWDVNLGGGAMKEGQFAYLAGEKAGGGGSGGNWYTQWGAIQPFSAAYVTSTTPISISVPQGIDDDRTGSNSNIPHPATTPTLPRPLLSRIAHILNRTPSSPLSSPTYASPADDTNNDDNNKITTLQPEPSIVRIAVLIAMPSPRPHSQPPSLSPVITSRPPESRHADEEQELDIGVAELPVLTAHPCPEESN